MIGRDPNRPFPVATGRPLTAAALAIADRRGHRQASVRWYDCFDFAEKQLALAHRLGQIAALERVDQLLAEAPPGRVPNRDNAYRLFELVDQLRAEIARRSANPLRAE
jgi:hypothetical protein